MLTSAISSQPFFLPGYHTYFCFVPIFSAKSSSERPKKEQSSVQQRAALGAKSGNAQNGVLSSDNRKKTGLPVQNKGSKRKQADSDKHGRSENEPPKKKQSTSVPNKTVNKVSNKKKLIAGQGTLTSFFRV